VLCNVSFFGGSDIVPRSPKTRRKRSYAFFLLAYPPGRTTKSSNSQKETEVIPAPVVMHFVKVHTAGKERADESEGRDDAMPETEPEPRDVATDIGGMCESIGAGSTTDHRQGNYNTEDCHQELCIPHELEVLYVK